MPLAAPDISAEDRQRVCAALQNPMIAGGPSVGEFEEKAGAELGLGPGVALISGTAALHMALLVVGVRAGDLVAMPSLTFVAPAHAASYLGARPLLFDSEPEYRQLDVGRLTAWLREECELRDGRAVHRASGKPIGAIVPVDLLGHLCDIAPLMETARELKIPVVEDAAQGLGATLRGRPVGAHADVTCLSFNANKIVTSGGGGMLLSKDEDLVEEVRVLANQAKLAGPDYIHDKVGFNYRLPSAQAALGLAQFRRLSDFIARKGRIARHYEGALADVSGLTLPRRHPEATVTNWLFTVHIDPEAFGHSTREVMERLAEEHRIETRPIFTPLHATGAYEGLQAEACPVAEGLAATGLSLPSSVTASDEDLERVCGALRSLAVS